ncbi:MAG: hypothetical protein WDM81_02610 [Rhizomicrobium sp.]
MLRIDGTTLGTQTVPVGHNATLQIPVRHGGENVVEVEAEPGPAELTLQNNRAVVTVSGVRDRLRVLLVSGEPHAGERVWRNLLKSDPSVDLIHFTILRPPSKQDPSIPVNELSLIAFPTQELFSEKLDSFDLVIFDRYSERGILPLPYFENLADYVDNGGALLVSSGPEFAGPMSISHTPLAAVLPAQPTGEIVTQGFKPAVTAQGMAHPVTRDLPGANTETAAPSWGPLVPRHRRQQGWRRDADERAGRPAAAGARQGSQGPRRGASVRPGLAVGARLRGRRAAGRIAAPAGALADEGAGAGRGAPGRNHRRRAHRGRAAHHGGPCGAG